MSKRIIEKFKIILKKHTIAYWICMAVVWFFVITAIITTGGTIAHIYRYHSELDRIEEEKKKLLLEMKQDSIHLELLNHDDYLEKYARERFHLIRKGETVYIEENGNEGIRTDRPY